MAREAGLPRPGLFEMLSQTLPRVIDAMTPETETTSHYFWGMARNFETSDAGFTKRFQLQQGNVFAEDVEVLEAQQRSVDRNPGLKLRAYAIDQGGVKARLVIERLRKAEAAGVAAG